MAALRLLVPWCCTVQRGVQKFTMAGSITEVKRSITMPVLQVENWWKKSFWLDHDYEEHDFLTVLGPSILLLATILIWAVSEPRSGQLCKKKKKINPGKKDWKLVTPFWKAFCPGWGWFCSFLSTDCQVMITKNFSTLRHEPWDFIRRWSSISQTLKQRGPWSCAVLSIWWEMGILEWWHKT